ncbi:uncharacterized protein JCM15063_005459 [Sporobolomyces koalae]|uniref:uncharacterized protein n=1 Tax=Sporobolomyces koalae TaxID=500713 RepID=UPI00316D4C80
MASYVAKKVGRKAFGNKVADIEPADPHYETYEDARGKKRTRKRAMPTGLSKRDERILRSVRRRAHYLDKGFSLCGFRFGWTAVLGLIPGAGDIAQFLLGFFLVLRKCRQAELPASLSSRMTFNQLAGLAIGLVPLVGDIGMAAFKANSRNAGLLEDFLVRRAQAGNPSAAEEERLAQAALESGGISKKTGEMDSVTAGADAQGRAAAAREAESGTRNKGFYGWGKGSSGPASETTTTGGVAPASASGTGASVGTTAARSNADYGAISTR